MQAIFLLTSLICTQAFRCVLIFTGGPYLTDAFGDVGFKQIFVTGPVRGIKSSKVS